MELNIVALVTLSVIVASLVSPSTCLHDGTIPSPRLYTGSAAPRKLKLIAVEDEARSATVLLSKHDQGKPTLFADRMQHKEEGMKKLKREGKEKEEELAMSDLTTMDYNHPKKRCPSHNESPPGAP